MHHTQLLSLVQALAVVLNAYVSVDDSTGAILLYEQGRVLFQPCKLMLYPVPYTDGAYYVKLSQLHFPAAFTPTEVRTHIHTAWDVRCDAGVRAGFLEKGFRPSEICKQ
jgi:hypothetical protein